MTLKPTNLKDYLQKYKIKNPDPVDHSEIDDDETFSLIDRPEEFIRDVEDDELKPIFVDCKGLSISDSTVESLLGIDQDSCNVKRSTEKEKWAKVTVKEGEEHKLENINSIDKIKKSIGNSETKEEVEITNRINLNSGGQDSDSDQTVDLDAIISQSNEDFIRTKKESDEITNRKESQTHRIKGLLVTKDEFIRNTKKVRIERNKKKNGNDIIEDVFKGGIVQKEERNERVDEVIQKRELTEIGTTGMSKYDEIQAKSRFMLEDPVNDFKKGSRTKPKNSRYPNRFGIEPSEKWDAKIRGVDYEAKWFSRGNDIDQLKANRYRMEQALDGD